MDYSMLIGVHNISLRTTKKILTSISQRTTVSAEDGDDRSNSSYGASASNATLDRFLDLDDDDSYLDGANPKGGKRVTTSLSDESFRTVRVVKSPDNADDESSKESKIGSDVILEKAIEDMYWPFHRFYDIQGLRRMKPVRDSLVVPELKRGTDSQYELTTFEKPLSYRKDAGFTMDTSAIDLPLKMSMPGAPHVVEYCDGKIVYMGIIDILQQFNIRKRVEAQYQGRVPRDGKRQVASIQLCMLIGLCVFLMNTLKVHQQVELQVKVVCLCLMRRVKRKRCRLKISVVRI